MAISDEVKEGAQELAVVVVAFLFFATICVMFSCYRICRERMNQRSMPTSLIEEPSSIYSITEARVGRVMNFEGQQQCDYDLIFGSSAYSIDRESVVISSVAVRPQNEYERILERRAQERRQILDADKNVLPPYNIKDESLPSYDQAIQPPQTQ